MNLLVDTHLVLWAAFAPKRLSKRARQLLEAPNAKLWFSAASIWEIAIKRTLNRTDFDVEPRRLRRGLLDNGWLELAISGDHAAAVWELAAIHKDPFDRMLVAQAQIEGLTLVTSDEIVARYPGQVRKV